MNIRTLVMIIELAFKNNFYEKYESLTCLKQCSELSVKKTKMKYEVNL